MRLKKFFIKLFVILSAVFVLMAPVFVIEEAHHDCTHEECQICEVIRTVEDNFKKLNVPTAASAIVLIPVAFALVLSVVLISKNIDLNTLITLKTKLTI